jgi:hypothetical protein
MTQPEDPLEFLMKMAGAAGSRPPAPAILNHPQNALLRGILRVLAGLFHVGLLAVSGQ